MGTLNWKKFIPLVLCELIVVLTFIGLEVPVFTTTGAYLESEPLLSNALNVDGWRFDMVAYTYRESLLHKLTGVGFCSVSHGFPEKSWYVNASYDLAPFPASNNLRGLEATLKANVNDTQFQELAKNPYPADLCDEHTFFTDTFLAPLRYFIFLILILTGATLLFPRRKH